jgi:mRNA-degrading endonuclease RelE of RelBE toxin-antitoxin system
MLFYNVPEFDKDLKKLKKKYRSLPQDLDVLRKFLNTEPTGHEPAVFPASYPQLKTIIPVYKVKEFRCKSLGGGSRSGIRIVYSFSRESQSILFVEIYHKERENTDCNVTRLKKYCEVDWVKNKLILDLHEIGVV